MPEGCLDRSTGWLPSNAGSAIHGPNPPHHQRKSPISLRQRDEKKAQPRPIRAGKERPLEIPRKEFRNPRSFIEIEEKEGGGIREAGWMCGLGFASPSRRRSVEARGRWSRARLYADGELAVGMGTRYL